MVTGASRGIGAAVARALAAPGRDLVLLARDRAALEVTLEACRARGAKGRALPADLSSADAGTRAAQELLERGGPPDLLVLNAGFASNARFESSALDSKLLELGVNYLAPLAMLQSLVPAMRGRPRSIVAVSSLTVHVPFPGNASYVASKAALFSLLRSLRVELAGDPLHLGVVLPGPTDTRMSQHMRTPLPAMSPERVARAVRRCAEESLDLVIPGLSNRLAARFFQSLPEVSDPLVATFSKLLLGGAR